MAEASANKLDLGWLEGDVFHRKEFHRFDEAIGYGKSLVYYYRDTRGTLAHQFMMRSIEKVGSKPAPPGLHDLESVRALAGPLSTNSDPEFLADAWSPYSSWCKENGVVCEYVRFNPFLRNEDIGRGFFDLSFSGRVGVVVDLKQTPEEIWTSQYDTRQRNMVRKAQNSGVVCMLDNSSEAFARFYELQTSSWVRLGALPDRIIPKCALSDLKSSLGNEAPLFVTKLNDEIIGASLFLASQRILHYQLSASDIRFRHTGAQNLLLHTTTLWAREAGFEKFHLAAGRTSRPNDELLRFKKSLSNGRVKYPVGTRRHLPDAFDVLCKIWQDQASGRPLPEHSMPYREPLIQ